MKISIWVFIGIVAVTGSYILGRCFERLTIVHEELGEIKLRLVKLDDQKVRKNVDWGWLQRIATNIPLISSLLLHKR